MTSTLGSDFFCSYASALTEEMAKRVYYQEQKQKLRNLFYPPPSSKAKVVKCKMCHVAITYRFTTALTHIDKKCEYFSAKINLKDSSDWPDRDFLLQQRKKTKTGRSTDSAGVSTSAVSLSLNERDAGSSGKLVNMSTGESRVLSSAEKNKWHSEILRQFVLCNLPLSSIRSNRTGWQRFVDYINNSGPGLRDNLPSVERLNGILEETSERVDTELGKLISEDHHTTVNLMVDGWRSVSKSHLLGVVVSRRDAQWSTNKNIDFLDDTGVNNATFIETIILEIEERFSVKIGSLITDNAAQMRKARDLLSQRFPHMIFNPCIAHQINLMARNVYKKSQCNIIDAATNLVSAIHSSDAALLIYRNTCDTLYGRSVATALLGISITRWNSAHSCLCSVLRVESALVQTCNAMVKRAKQRKKPLDPAFELDPNFFSSCREVEETLRPLVLASLAMQKDEQDFANVFNVVVQLHQGFRILPISQ